MGLEAMQLSRVPGEGLQQLAKLRSIPVNWTVTHHSIDISSAASLNLPLVSGHKAMTSGLCTGLSELHYKQLPKLPQAGSPCLYIQRNWETDGPWRTNSYGQHMWEASSSLLLFCSKRVKDLRVVCIMDSVWAFRFLGEFTYWTPLEGLCRRLQSFVDYFPWKWGSMLHSLTS